MMRDTRTLKNLFPDPKPPRRKNFIKENVKSLRRMEQIFQTNGNSANDLKLPILKRCVVPKKSSDINSTHNNNGNKKSQHQKTQEIFEHETVKNNKTKNSALLSNTNKISNKLSKSSVKTTKLVSSESQSVENIETEVLNKKLKDIQTDIQCISQGVQTLDTDDINSLYSEGVIRYPSGRTKEVKEPVNTKSSLERCDNDVNIKLNKEHIPLASKLASQLNAPPSHYRIGVVPKYLKERKEALQKEQLARIADKHTDCPIGHVPLPDNERKETLSMLKKNYQEYVSELNMLPIRTDTLRSQRRKMEIEKQLTKLEEAIKVFTRPKVFVKVDS